MQEMGIRSLGWENPLEEEMAICSSIHAWKIPRTEEPGHGSQKRWTRLRNPNNRFLRTEAYLFFFSFKYSEVEYSKNRLWLIFFEGINIRHRPQEKEMAAYFSILVWRIPWTEEPGRLQSMGSQRIWHDWATNTLHRSLTSRKSTSIFVASQRWMYAHHILKCVLRYFKMDISILIMPVWELCFWRFSKFYPMTNLYL